MAKQELSILIVDDDSDVRDFLSAIARGSGHKVRMAAGCEEAKGMLDEDLDVVLLDLQMPGTDGLTCLDYIKERLPDLQVIMVSSIEKVASVVEAMRRGAFWYISKQATGELGSLIARAARHTQLCRENRQLRAAVGMGGAPAPCAGVSDIAKRLAEKSAKVAALDSSVLITGESGTGKSALARRIHELGPRRDAPFVFISCAALPRDLLESELFGYERGAFTGAVSSRPGRIEMADGGTLFLDEIGDLALDLQPKLLVFLQERIVQRIGGSKAQKVDVRVIAATNQPLEEMCQEKRFREDLYFRLNVLPLELPSLRERRDDILPFARHKLAALAATHGKAPLELSPGACQKLESYEWPGNIRELENAVEQAWAFASGPVLEAGDFSLKSNLRKGSAGLSSLAGMKLEEIERQAILQAIESCGGNKAAAARMLGISEKTIYNKLEK